MENKKCVSCGNDIHPKRLKALPNTNKCVNCSSESKKAGVVVMKGEGDHTYTETIIMDREKFEQFKIIEEKTNKKLGFTEE